MGKHNCEVWVSYTRQIQKLFSHANEITEARNSADEELEMPAPDEETVSDFWTGASFTTERFDEVFQGAERSGRIPEALASIRSAYRDLCRERDEHVLSCDECQKGD